MRLVLVIASGMLAAFLSGCTAVQLGMQVPMWNDDPAKIARLGKGASMSSVDAALGRTHVLWTHSAEINGKPYQFRLYDWVQSTTAGKIRFNCAGPCSPFDNLTANKMPFAIVYEGTEPRLYAWGTLSALRDAGDPIVGSLLPRLREEYQTAKTWN